MSVSILRHLRASIKAVKTAFIGLLCNTLAAIPLLFALAWVLDSVLAGLLRDIPNQVYLGGLMIILLLGNLLVVRYLHLKYQGALYAAVWLLTLPVSILILISSTAMHSSVPNPLWIVGITLCLVLIFSIPLSLLESRIPGYRFKKVISYLAMLPLVLLIYVIPHLSPAMLICNGCPSPDSKILSSINNSRAQAELFYINRGESYKGVCSISIEQGGIKEFIFSPRNVGPVVASCYDEATAWAAEVELPSGEGSYCADSTGQAIRTEGSSISADDLVCGY